VCVCPDQRACDEIVRGGVPQCHIPPLVTIVRRTSSTKIDRSNAEGAAESVVQKALLGAASDAGASTPSSPTPLQITMALKSVRSWAMRKVVLVSRQAGGREDPPPPHKQMRCRREGGFHIGGNPTGIAGGGDIRL